MILLDTSMYIAAAQDVELEKLLDDLSQKIFIQSCDIVEEEINDSLEFLRKTDRKQQAEELGLVYAKLHKGNIAKSEEFLIWLWNITRRLSYPKTSTRHRKRFSYSCISFCCKRPNHTIFEQKNNGFRGNGEGL